MSSAAEPARENPRERGSLISWLLIGAAVLAVGWAYRSIALPLLLGGFVAYALNPLVVRMEENGLPRGQAVVRLFLGAVLVALLAGLALGPAVQRQARAAIEGLPAFADKVEKVAATSLAPLRRDSPLLDRLLPETEPGWTSRLLEEQSTRFAELATEHLAELAMLPLLLIVFAFFLLRDGGNLLSSMVRRLPPRQIETSVAVWCEIDRILGQYLRGLLIESAIVGTLAAIGLWALGVPVPIFLGLFTALVNPIPYVGALLSFSLAALVTLAADLGTGTLVAVAILFVVVRLIDDLVVIPVTIGGSVHLHPALVIASILAGEHLLGVLGMVLAIPVVTIVKEVVRLLVEHHRNAQRALAAAQVEAVAEHFPC